LIGIDHTIETVFELAIAAVAVRVIAPDKF
jgi:hypothetical protein